MIDLGDKWCWSGGDGEMMRSEGRQSRTRTREWSLVTLALVWSLCIVFCCLHHCHYCCLPGKGVELGAEN